MKILETVRRIYTAPIRFYRKYISKLKGAPSCRFQPTCSEYAVEAVMEWGIVIGTVLAVIRIIRCNPFSKGGYDPVPARREIFGKIKELFCNKSGEKTKTE